MASGPTRVSIRKPAAAANGAQVTAATSEVVAAADGPRTAGGAPLAGTRVPPSSARRSPSRRTMLGGTRMVKTTRLLVCAPTHPSTSRSPRRYPGHGPDTNRPLGRRPDPRDRRRPARLAHGDDGRPAALRPG